MKLLHFFLLALIIAACGNDTGEPGHQQTGSANKDTYDSPKLLRNKNTVVAWRKNVYHSQLGDSMNTIIVDTMLCKTISDVERAALGFVITFIGNECYWDGGEKEDMGNLKCKLTDALNLGYQCSEKHLNFLRSWFRKDTASLSRIKDCPLIPYTASMQTTFDEIRLTVKGNLVIIWYRANGMDMHTNDAWYWTQEDTFMVDDNNLTLLRSRKLEEKKEKFAS